MFGKILSINKNSAIVSVSSEVTEIGDLINMHVVFEDDDEDVIGICTLEDIIEEVLGKIADEYN